MKRYLLFIITGVTLLWNPSIYAAGELGENGGINDNPHNLNSQSTTPVGETDIKATTSTQICIFCHTPHGATPESTLWSRPDPGRMTEPFPIRSGLGISDAGIVGTTLYDNSSGDYPNGASKLCLSCHDGVTAIGILANSDEIDMNLYSLSGRDSEIDLAISHPISFVYNQAVQIYLGTADYEWPTSAHLDGDSRVQCTTCHQPHQDTKNGSYSLPFWRGTGIDDVAEYDDICADCHKTPPPAYTEHAY